MVFFAASLLYLSCSAPTASCKLFSSTNSRLTFDSPDCIEIGNALFANITSSAAQDGGAIYCGSNEFGSAFVHDSTFLRLSLTTAGWWGAGCYFKYTKVVIMRCCGDDCYADRGNFCCLRNGGSSRAYRTEFSQMTTIRCGSGRIKPTNTYNGAVYFDEAVDGTLNHCNFTNNTGTAGAVLLGRGDTGVFNASWLTVFGTLGNSAVETVRKTFPWISYANFVNNPINTGYGVLYADDWGMILIKCFFMGNTLPNVYRSKPGTATNPFLLYQCYFDGSLPGATHATVVEQCYTSTNTQLEIQHYHNNYCQAQFPYESSPFTATGEFNLTNVFSQSRSRPSPSPVVPVVLRRRYSRQATTFPPVN
jgi:hypothetical protein